MNEKKPNILDEYIKNLEKISKKVNKVPYRVKINIVSIIDAKDLELCKGEQ